MQYPILIYKDKDSDYGVNVPDLPGCYSAGATIEEAIQNAHEAIECHLEGLLIDNDPIPRKRSLEYYFASPEAKEGMLVIIDVDISRISGKVARINVSIPERFLKQIDDYAKKNGVNRSGFLLDAAMSYIAEHRI